MMTKAVSMGCAPERSRCDHTTSPVLKSQQSVFILPHITGKGPKLRELRKLLKAAELVSTEALMLPALP